MTTTSNTTFQPTFGRKVIDRLDDFIKKRRKSKLPRIRRTKLTSKRAGRRKRVRGVPKATRRHHRHKRVKKSFLESLSDFLSKAYRPGLVRTKVKVKRGGKTFERWQWVRPDDIDAESSISWANNNLNYDSETRHMAEELDAIRDRASIGNVSGERTDENKNTVNNNISGYLSNFEEHLDAVTYNRVNSSARSLIDSLWTAGGDHSAKDVQDLARDSVDKLLYQEVSSWERQLGDHGIRHISGNVDRCSQILDQLKSTEHNVTDREKLMAQVIMVNHDLGYTSKYCRQGIKQTKKHKEFSAAMFRKQRDLFSRFFNDEELEQMENFILVHDAPFIDWKKEPLLSTITVSDNLSLYQSEKLPPLFRFVKDGVDILSDMQKAYKEEDEEEFKKLKDKLFSSIDSAKLPKFTKKMLKKAAMAVGPLTAKFVAPVIVGDLDDVKYDSEKGLSVSVKYNEHENKLRSLFEMGQSKLHSFFKDYGVDASDRTEISIPGKLSVSIKGFTKKSFDNWIEKRRPTPPRPGLRWKEETHRWVRPEKVSKPKKAMHFESLDSKYAKGLEKGINKTYDKYGHILANKIKYIGPARSAKEKKEVLGKTLIETVGAVVAGDSILVNDKESVDEMLSVLNEDEYRDEITVHTYEDMITHEIGHTMTHLWGESEIGMEDDDDWIYEEIREAIEEGNGVEITRDDIRTDISEYAASDVDECLAEMFVLRMKGEYPDFYDEMGLTAWKDVKATPEKAKKRWGAMSQAEYNRRMKEWKKKKEEHMREAGLL